MARYDVAVAGAGLGGLAAAALLARRGKRVVLIDPEQSAGGELKAVAAGQFSFSPGPLLSFGFERGGALQRFCSDLGISVNTTVPSPVYQVALPDRRISVFSDMTETLEELRREFPAEIDAISRFFSELRSRNGRYATNRLSAFRSRHTRARAFIASYGFSREFEAFLNCGARVFRQRDAGDLTMASLVSVFDGVPLAIEGGFPRLCGQLVSSVLSNGGEIRYREPAASVLERSGRAVGVQLGSGEMIEAGAVVVNAASPGRYSALFLGLPETALPAGMAHAVFSIPSLDDPDGMFTVSVDSQDRSLSGKPGMRSLTVLFPFRDLADDALSSRSPVVEHLIPFLSDFVLLEQRHVPARSDYSYPAPTGRSSGQGGSADRALAPSALKNMFVLADDARSPLAAVTAARTIENTLSR